MGTLSFKSSRSGSIGRETQDIPPRSCGCERLRHEVLIHPTGQKSSHSLQGATVGDHLITRKSDRFVKIDTENIDCEGIWFYKEEYDIASYLSGDIIRLPRWINCSCSAKDDLFIDALVGRPNCGLR